MTSVRNEKTTAFTSESCGIFKMDCLLEQLAASPDADTGSDDRDDDLTHEAGSGQAHEAEEDAAHKAAQDAQHDVAQGAGLTAHDAACNVTGQRTDEKTEDKTKHKKNLLKYVKSDVGCFLPRVAADVRKTAFFALRLPGIADGPAMHHETVAQITALFGRDDLPERHLHLLRFLDAVHKADLVAQADAVGVGDDGGLAEHVAHDEICALAAHAGQCQQFLKGRRYLAVVLVPQHPHTG